MTSSQIASSVGRVPKRRTRPATALPSYVVLCLGSVIMLVPFVWMVLTSFKTFAETLMVPIQWLPAKFSLENYSQVLRNLSFGTYYINTIFVTLSITTGQAFICSLAAFAFARLKFPLKDPLFLLVLAVLMVPMQMIIIPEYLLCSSLRIVNTLWGIIIPGLPSAFATFFLRQGFMELPQELEDSAKIDGCSYFRTYWNIMLPLCKSPMIAFVIFTVLWAWNDLLWPLIITSSDQVRVLSIGIAVLQGAHYTEFQLLMAASVIATIPVLVVFTVGQRYFLEGMALSGIKA